MSPRCTVENEPSPFGTEITRRSKSCTDPTDPLGNIRTYLSSTRTLPASAAAFCPSTTRCTISGVMPRFAIFARDISNDTISCRSPRRSIFATSSQRSSSRRSSFACALSSASVKPSP